MAGGLVVAQSNTAPKMVETTDDPRAIHLMDHPDSTEEIPTIDISDYLAGDQSAIPRVAADLAHVTETIGFFYLTGHGVPPALIDSMFVEGRRFFALPLEEKRKVPRVDNTGYVEMKDPEQNGNQYLVKKKAPPLNESFIINRERSADDPDIVAKKIFCSMNSWPRDLPGFRETLLSYHSTIEALGRKFLPLWAASLDLPLDFFDRFFGIPHCNLRLAHYPPQHEVGTGQYGSVPHTDNCLMTFLAQANVPGLAVQMPSGHWRAVELIPGTLVVNTGNLMLRWTNGRYRSTKHRVINQAGTDRYSFPVFFGPQFDTPIDCLPTCCGPDNPPQFEPITYENLRRWYYGFYN
jgi:isopenicillin N synthase-like dioxygenase